MSNFKVYFADSDDKITTLKCSENEDFSLESTIFNKYNTLIENFNNKNPIELINFKANMKLSDQFKFIDTLCSIILIFSDKNKKIIHSTLYFSNTNYFCNLYDNDINQFMKYIDSKKYICKSIGSLIFEDKGIKIIDKLLFENENILDLIIELFNKKRSLINDFLINVIILFNLKISDINIDIQYHTMFNKKKNFKDEFSKLRIRNDNNNMKTLSEIYFFKEKIWKLIKNNQEIKRFLTIIYRSILEFEINLNVTSNDEDIILEKYLLENMMRIE
jgi:hypothetical protein